MLHRYAPSSPASVAVARGYAVVNTRHGGLVVYNTTDTLGEGRLGPQRAFAVTDRHVGNATTVWTRGRVRLFALPAEREAAAAVEVGDAADVQLLVASDVVLFGGASQEVVVLVTAGGQLVVLESLLPLHVEESGDWLESIRSPLYVRGR